jgi:magnesium transporter
MHSSVCPISSPCAPSTPSRRLQRDTKLGIATEDQELLEDALVEFRQAVEMTRVSEEILSNMMDAFASIISNNLNVVMKVLTSLTIVLTFPMLVVSIYGMNVELPFAGSPRALAIVLLFALCLGGFVAIVFRRRHWL